MDKKNAATQVTATNNASKNYNWNSFEAQRCRLLDVLRQRPLTTIEGRTNSLIDVMHVGGRIMELRRQGHLIVTEWAWELTPEGKGHKVARYVLLSAPSAIKSGASDSIIAKESSHE